MAETIKDDKYEFVLTDKVPFGYRIWGIGKNMISGYLPFVKTGGYDGCQVDTKKMFAIKINGAQTVLDAVGYGPDTIIKMSAFISRYDQTGCMQASVDRMKKAIPIIKRIEGIRMNYKIIIPAWLSMSIVIDYACTLLFAGTRDHLINNEHSPVLIYTVEHNILIPYIILIMAVYFICAYIALDSLHHHRLLPAAYTSITLVALAHTFGGLSWYIRNSIYSGTIIIIPQLAGMIMCLCMVYLLLEKVLHVRN